MFYMFRAFGWLALGLCAIPVLVIYALGWALIMLVLVCIPPRRSRRIAVTSNNYYRPLLPGYDADDMSGLAVDYRVADYGPVTQVLRRAA
jgi:hypothetical protein